MKELITIIINVYNGEKFINKCLDSVINQTYKNLEIIIVNDGSTDNTLKLCKEYKDKRIRIITTKNMGLSLSRNIGLDNAKGEYLYFVDVDDFIELDTIEYLYNLIKKYNVKMATCKAQEIYNYDFKYKNKKEKVRLLTTEEMLTMNVLATNYAINTWNKLYKKELFNNIRFEDRIMNDLALTYKIIIKCDFILYSNQIKYYYLRNSDSITIKNKTDLKRNIDRYYVFLERYNYINERYPKLISNRLGLLRNIVLLYTKQNSKLHEFLDKQNVKKLYKELFTIKVLWYKMRLMDKIIIILFRISPKLYNFCLKIFLKLKKIYNKKTFYVSEKR